MNLFCLFLLVFSGPASAGPRPAAAPIPAAASIEARVIDNFTGDQTANWRYRHTERITIVKNGRRESRTVRIRYIRGHADARVIAVGGRGPLRPWEIAAQRQAAARRALALARRPPLRAGGFSFRHHWYSFKRLAGDFLYGPGAARLWRGRTVWVYPLRPNPAVRGRTMEEKILLYSRGQIWIDARSLHVARIQLATFAPVHYWLGLLATVQAAGLDFRLHPRSAAAVWLPAYVRFYVRSRILIFKKFRETKTQRFSDYARAAPAVQ